MKSKTLLTLSLLTAAYYLQSQTLENKLTGQDLWEKVIAYHDPQGIWSTYKGILQEVTVFPNNYVVRETIEINRPDDYYLSTAFQDFGTIRRGMDKGKPFFSLNDNPDVPEEIKNSWGLSETGLTQFKEWHTSIFGLPMNLKSTGMRVQEKVNIVDFNGRQCYELTFMGTPDVVSKNIYTGKVTLYADIKTYSMHGSKWNLEGMPAIYVVYDKEVGINGLKVPHVMIHYNVENDTRNSTSINDPVAK